ncbi:transposase [Streptomyces sp. AV19]|nr:transposase [Streptomyces sp. AV19]
MIDGILHRVRTGVQWRDLPERFGPWKTVYERHRLWSADGTWERLLQQVQAAAGEINWDVSVDSTIIRAHRANRMYELYRAGPGRPTDAWKLLGIQATWGDQLLQRSFVAYGATTAPPARLAKT